MTPPASDERRANAAAFFRGGTMPPSRRKPATPDAVVVAAEAAQPAPAAEPAAAKPAVAVVQIDTRDAHARLHGPMRTWPGGDTHDLMRHAYEVANPPQPKKEHWAVTPVANAWQCRLRGWGYSFRHMDAGAVAPRSASWVKIRWILDSWDGLPAEGWTMLLDTDAWIRDGAGLEAVLRDLGPGVALVGAEDPVCREGTDHQATDFNGGFVCFRKDPRVREFMQAVWDLADHPVATVYRTAWPWEQACLCRMVRQHAGEPWIRMLPVEACNTPAGTYVSHCWFKELAVDLAIEDMMSSMAAELLGVPKPTCELVVARYGEDMGWMRHWVAYADRITVYDKSAEPMVSPHPKVRVVSLPNVGREAHTYAHHFAEHYDDLCDAVVCTQGAYADHMTHAAFDALMRTGQRGAETLDMAWSHTPMSRYGWTEDHNWAPDQPMLPMGMSMGKFFLTYISDDLVPETTVEWWPNAVFAVKGTDVTRNPRARYEAIRDALSTHSNPEAAHAMERFWKVLLAG